MRKYAIKGMLFSLIGLVSAPVMAQISADNGDLILIEELPREIRSLVHKKVVEYLRENPQLIDEASTVALDSKGMIYVLDKKMAAIANAGQPSCITDADFVFENSVEKK